MSKTFKEGKELKVSKMPTIRLYTAQGKFVQYTDRDRSYAAFVKFLTAQKVMKWIYSIR